jgi:hypothetical protein
MAKARYPYRQPGFKAKVAKKLAKEVAKYPRDQWEAYFNWQAEQDGYADLLKACMSPKEYAALEAYWEQTGQVPDSASLACLKQAEMAHFGRCVEDEM